MRRQNRSRASATRIPSRSTASLATAGSASAMTDATRQLPATRSRTEDPITGLRNEPAGPAVRRISVFHAFGGGGETDSSVMASI